jgi:hypothetical protein
MRSGICAAVLFSALAFGGLGHVPAASAAPPAPVVVHISDAAPPILLAQYGDSSSSRTRSSRGVVRLVVFGIILAVGAVGWVIKQVAGS